MNARRPFDDAQGKPEQQGFELACQIVVGALIALALLGFVCGVGL